MGGAALQVGLRLRGARALRVGLRLAGPAAFAWILLRLGASLGLIPASALGPAALALAGVVAAGVLAAAVLARLGAADAIAEIDRRLLARGRLIAAWELADHRAPLAAVAVSDARAWIARGATLRSRVRAAFPIRWPAGASRPVTLIALAAVSALVLANVRIDLPHRRTLLVGHDSSTPAAVPPPESMLAALSPSDVPTLQWAMQKLQESKASNRGATQGVEPRPKTTPAELASASVDPSVPILDPNARAFFEAMTSESMRRQITNEIGDYYTGSAAPEVFDHLETLSKLNPDPSFGDIPQDNQSEAFDMEAVKMPGEKMGGDIAPKVDPTESKHDYIQQANTMAELSTAMKESFNQYLQEFANQVLQGLEDGLRRGLTSGKGHGDAAHGGADELPPGPAGVAEGKTPGQTQGAEDAPFLAARADADAPPSAYMPGAPQSVGGTAAGGVGAGAGAGDESGTSQAMSGQDATGPRLDLHGTLNERLAVVDVVEKMRVDALPLDGPEAEVVARITRDAEGQALTGADVPADYRDTIAAYFRTLSAGNPPETP